MNLETDNKIQKKGITLVIPNPCGNIKETKMKNSGIEWIGEIPDEWEVSKIGQLYEERKTKVSDTVYPPLSVTMQGILPQLETAAKSDAHDDRKLVLKGDFVINSRSDRRGSCGISEFNGSVSLINTVLHPKNEMNPIYYNWLFHSFRFSDEYYKNGHGIVDDLWTTSWTEMKKIFIPLPPKETQQRIASYLDKKCSKIEETIQKQQQVIEKLKAYKQSLITEAVTGKVKIENGKACGEYESYKDSGVEWIGKIPSGWEIKKAKYFIKISNGSDPKTEEGDTPVYGSGAESFKTCVEFKEGPTVLIGRKGATLHIPHYIEGNYWNVDTAFDVKTYSEEILLLKFYYYCATAFDYRFYLTSTTLPSMTQTNYGNMYLPVPNTLVQKEIVEFLDNKYDAIDTAIEQKQKLIEKLTEYKKSLIYECVTGKKEVN